MVGMSGSPTVTLTGGNVVNLFKFGSFFKYCMIQSSRQDLKLMMVNSCCAFGCTNAVGKKKGHRFYRFPLGDKVQDVPNGSLP